ncbi:MAG: hypothetical protein ABW000_14370 [Actinoplanes sp.]
MNQRGKVFAGLNQMYRPIGLWFWCTLIVGVAVADVIIETVADPGFSLWLAVAGSAAKYWLGVVGVLLISTNLRYFVAGGITRRDFLAGSARFGLVASLLFAVIVPVGHGVEAGLRGLNGPLPADYPHFSVSVALGEFAHQLPSCLAFLVAGAAVTAGFYRFGAWRGLALLVPALLPVAFAEVLLGIDDAGELGSRFVPVAVAVLLTLVVTALVVLLGQRTLRHTAIR